MSTPLTMDSLIERLEQMRTEMGQPLISTTPLILKSNDQLALEIAALTNMKDRMRGGLPVNHPEAIDAQITVFTHRMTHRQVSDVYGFGSEYVLGAAHRAMEWMTGVSVDAPSVDWRGLII